MIIQHKTTRQPSNINKAAIDKASILYTRYGPTIVFRHLHLYIQKWHELAHRELLANESIARGVIQDMMKADAWLKHRCRSQLTIQ
jgi:hypothetical protein